MELNIASYSQKVYLCSIGLAAYAGESVPLRGDDFKRYVNSLRGKVRIKEELISL